MADDEALVAAIAYGARGWAAFPVAGVRPDGRCMCGGGCGSPGKHPLTPHGLSDATIDSERLRAWGRRWRGANIGVATGPASGIVVVDVDLAKGGDASLAKLLASGFVLPATLTARTGGGGLHLVYCHPDVPLRNTAGRLPGAGPLQGIDLRAEGGYVVVPPSRHASGARYGWEDPGAPTAALPGWMRELPRRPESGRESPRRRGLNGSSGSRYGLAALDRELRRLASSPAGTRNHELNRAAFVLGTLVGSAELDEGLVVGELTRTGLGIGLGEREVAATVRSGITAGLARPRTAPRRDVSRGHRDAGPPGGGGAALDPRRAASVGEALQVPGRANVAGRGR
jgi:hypothetical protein